jgi:hypothetical protein
MSAAKDTLGFTYIENQILGENFHTSKYAAVK